MTQCTAMRGLMSSVGKLFSVHTLHTCVILLQRNDLPSRHFLNQNKISFRFCPMFHLINGILRLTLSAEKNEAKKVSWQLALSKK